MPSLKISENNKDSEKSCGSLLKFVQINISQTYLGREYSPSSETYLLNFVAKFPLYIDILQRVGLLSTTKILQEEIISYA